LLKNYLCIKWSSLVVFNHLKLEDILNAGVKSTLFGTAAWLSWLARLSFAEQNAAAEEFFNSFYLFLLPLLQIAIS
jgi:hypothetical protein